jgi:hypothetical protein
MGSTEVCSADARAELTDTEAADVKKYKLAASDLQQRSIKRQLDKADANASLAGSLA